MELIYSRQAQKDAKKLTRSGLKPKAKAPVGVLPADPVSTPPRCEKLVGCYSRRINIQLQLVYEGRADDRVLYVLRMWSHYE